MRIPGFALILALILSAQPVQASSWIDYIITPAPKDFKRPYSEDAITPHGTQWENDDWTPEAWVQSRGSMEAVLEGLYNANIITDKEFDADEPVVDVDVGYRFLRLADKEKIHVVRFIDYVTGTTKKDGVIQLQYDKGWLWHAIPLGLYTKDGLQLQ